MILGCQEADSSTALSRHVAAVRMFEDFPPRRFLDRLEGCVRRDKPDFVFPVGETQLRRLLRDPARFALIAPLTTWVMPDSSAVLRCFDKRAMYQLAAQLGVPTPPWRPYTRVEEWLQGAEELGYPVVVKRKDSSALVRTKKALICRNAAEFEGALGEIMAEPEPESLLLQKHAAGARHNCHVAARDGRMVAYFQQKVLRTDEPDDTGIGIEGISVEPLPPLRLCCERLVASFHYTGIGCIQFLVDEETKSVAFLEFNPRMDSTAALPYRLGFDFPLLAVRLAAGEPVEAPAGYPAGKRYYWLYGDVSAWLARRGSEPLRDTLRWLVQMPRFALRSYDLVLEWRDPVPGLHQLWRKAVDCALKLVQRVAGKHTIEPGARP